MSGVEDRTRAALDAVTRQVDSAPPLPLPPPPERAAARRRWHAAPPWRRWAPWLVPAAAAAAVIAVAVSLVIVKDVSAGQPASPAPAGVQNTAPRYYVAIPGDMANAPVGAPDAIVGDTFTGQPLATVPAPAGWTFISVTAAADDRAFVVGAAYDPQPPAPVATRWYLIRLTPGSTPFATVRELPVSLPAATRAGAVGLSPDGTELAMIDHSAAAPVALRLYAVATGAPLHVWSSSAAEMRKSGEPEGYLSWLSDGRQLAFGTFGPALRVSLRLLPVDDPGHDLLADSQPVWFTTAPDTVNPTGERPFSCGGSFAPSALVTGNGTTVVCGASAIFRSQAGFDPDDACPAVPPWNAEGVLEYSAATGKLTRTLYRGESGCTPSDGPVELLWTSASGDAAIGYVDFGGLTATMRPFIRFGLITAGKFTPLPAPPTITTDPANTAW